MTITEWMLSIHSVALAMLLGICWVYLAEMSKKLDEILLEMKTRTRTPNPSPLTKTIPPCETSNPPDGSEQLSFTL